MISTTTISMVPAPPSPQGCERYDSEPSAAQAPGGFLDGSLTIGRGRPVPGGDSVRDAAGDAVRVSARVEAGGGDVVGPRVEGGGQPEVALGLAGPVGALQGAGEREVREGVVRLALQDY